MIEYVTYKRFYRKGYVNQEPDAHAYEILSHWLIPTREAFKIASM